MAGRRSLLALVLLAATLHTAGIARSLLPAQDGLKFLRIAREFQLRPWPDVVRDSDQHPLYPALVAVAQPLVAAIAGPGPDAWRIAAQGVAAIASLLLLVPLYGLSRSLFDGRVARLAVLIYVLLPLPAVIGHDTLSDSLALLASLSALRLGEVALRSSGWIAALGCGLAAGVGFLARPEVAVVPVAVVLTWVSLRPRTALSGAAVPGLAAVGLSFLVMVGAYAIFKGDVSEKLALRIGAGLGSRPPLLRKVKQWAPPGLDDPRLSFAPKEESEEPEPAAAPAIAGRLFLQWAGGLCGVFAFFTAWGVARDRFIRGLCDDRRGEEPAAPDAGRRLVAVYLALFSLVLVRHASRMGYLSDRHTLMLVAASIPWAAAGTFVCARGLAIKLRWRGRTARLAGALGVLVLLASGGYLQAKPAHPSRWGHRAAGRWLAENAGPADAVLDTRGWAAFVSGRPSYDYWHVRQAFTDSHLAYIVVGTGELSAPSRRAETLRAVLAYAARPVAEFPERRDGRGHADAGVRVYRYRAPESWEGLRP